MTGIRHEISDEQLVRVHNPIGMNLGGCRPEEIALAIMAEIVAVRKWADIGVRFNWGARSMEQGVDHNHEYHKLVEFHEKEGKNSLNSSNSWQKTG